MFRINTNVFSVNVQRHLVETSQRMRTSIERLASGLRINRAGDDPAGLGAAELFRAQIAGGQAAKRNITRSLALLQTAESGYEQVLSMFSRLKELAVAAADGTLGDSSRSAISLEAHQLFQEMSRIARATVFNGITLISSSLGTTGGGYTVFTFFVGDGSVTVATDNPQKITVFLPGIGVSVGAVSGGGLICLGAIGGAGAGVTLMLTVNDFLNPASAGDLTAKIESAILQMASVRTTVGAYQNRLMRSQLAMEAMLENAINAESVIRDADFAEETSALTRSQIIVQAGASVLTQANTLPQMALLLLNA
jgi:flagellin